MSQNSLYIGTSGWSYSEWLGNFYPEKTSDYNEISRGLAD